MPSRSLGVPAKGRRALGGESAPSKAHAASGVLGGTPMWSMQTWRLGRAAKALVVTTVEIPGARQLPRPLGHHINSSAPLIPPALDTAHRWPHPTLGMVPHVQQRNEPTRRHRLLSLRYALAQAAHRPNMCGALVAIWVHYQPASRDLHALVCCMLRAFERPPRRAAFLYRVVARCVEEQHQTTR